MRPQIRSSSSASVRDENVSVGQDSAVNGFRPNPPQQIERTHVAISKPRGSLVHNRVRQLGLEGAEIEVEHRLLVTVHGGLAYNRFEPLRRATNSISYIKSFFPRFHLNLNF